MIKLITYVSKVIVYSLSVYVFIFCLLYAIPYKGKPLLYISNSYYTWKGGTTYFKTREFDAKEKYDIVFIGSSRSYRGYNPFFFEEKGLKAFNLGTSAQSAKNTYFLALHNINNNYTGLLIVDLFAGAFVGSDIESSSDIIQNASGNNLAFDIAMHNADIRCWNVYFNRLLASSLPPFYKDIDYKGKGFAVRTDSIGTKGIGFMTNDKEEYTIDQEQLFYFKKLLSFLHENKINALFVYSPVLDLRSIKVKESFTLEIIPLLQGYGFQWLDYSAYDKIISPQHFYDETHLNDAGVRIFNEKLLQDLVDKNFLRKQA